MGWYRAVGGVLAILCAFSLQAGKKKKKKTERQQQRTSATTTAASMYPTAVYLDPGQNTEIAQELGQDVQFYPAELQTALDTLQKNPDPKILTIALRQVHLMLRGQTHAPHLSEVHQNEMPAEMRVRQKDCVVTALFRLLPHLTKFFSLTWKEKEPTLQSLKLNSKGAILPDEKWDKMWLLLGDWLGLYKRAEAVHREKLYRIAPFYFLQTASTFLTPHYTALGISDVCGYQTLLQPHEKILLEYCCLLQQYSNLISTSDEKGWRAIYHSMLCNRLLQAVLSPYASNPSLKTENLCKTFPQFIQLEEERRTHLPENFDTSNHVKILHHITQVEKNYAKWHIDKSDALVAWAEKEDRCSLLEELGTHPLKSTSFNQVEAQEEASTSAEIDEVDSAVESPLAASPPQPQWEVWHQNAVSTFSKGDVVTAEKWFLQALEAAREAETPCSKQLELEYCLLDFYMAVVFDPRFYAVDPSLLPELQGINLAFYQNQHQIFPEKPQVDAYFKKIQQFLDGRPYFEKAQASMRRCGKFSEADWHALPAGLSEFVSDTLEKLVTQKTAYTPAYMQALRNAAILFVQNRTVFIRQKFGLRGDRTNPAPSTNRTHDLLHRLQEIDSASLYDESIVQSLLQKTQKLQQQTQEPKQTTFYPRSWKSTGYTKSAEAPN